MVTHNKQLTHKNQKKEANEAIKQKARRKKNKNVKKKNLKQDNDQHTKNDWSEYPCAKDLNIYFN